MNTQQQQPMRQMPPQQFPPQMMQQQPNIMGSMPQQLQNQFDNLFNSTEKPRMSKEDRDKIPSLHVSNLPELNFFDLDLYKLFTSKGYTLKSAKVIINKKSSKPSGSGFLQFHSKAEATRCQEEMNNFEYRGHALRIVHSVPDPKQYNTEANIHIKNIDKDVTQQELFDAFKRFGTIVSCKLESYPDGSSRGMAYIQFSTPEEAKISINEMNQYEIKGKKIDVNKHEKKGDRGEQPAKFNNLFVGNLPIGTTDEQLIELFKEFGEIESAGIMKDAEDKLKNQGYVCFKNHESAEAAMNKMNKTQVGDHFLIVNKFISKRDNELALGHGNTKVNPISQNLATTFNSNIYIKFIPNEVTEEQLRAKFHIEGSNIVSVKLQPFKKNVNGTEIQPYQYAYILYDTVAAAQRAIQLFDQSPVFSTRNILVELWISKEDKEAEKKKKESQQLNQFLNNIMNLTKSQSYPPQFGQQPFPQQPMGLPGQNPNYQQPQFQQQNRGGYQNNRGGRGGARGGQYQNNTRGGRGGMPPQNQYQRPPQQYGQMPQQPIQVPNVPQAQVDINVLNSITDNEERRNFVGNAIYSGIETIHGANAGKITGMLLDEKVVDFTKILTDQNYFNTKVFEANQLLIQSNYQQQMMMQQQQQQQQQQVPQHQQ